MISTVLLAKFFGIFWTVLGIGMASSQERFDGLMNDVARSRGMQLIAGIIPLILGAFVVVFHSHVNSDGWSTFICIIGLLMLLGGLFRLWFTSTWLGMIAKWQGKMSATMAGGVVTIVGLALLYHGYWS